MKTLNNNKNLFLISFSIQKFRKENFKLCPNFPVSVKWRKFLSEIKTLVLVRIANFQIIFIFSVRKFLNCIQYSSEYFSSEKKFAKTPRFKNFGQQLYNWQKNYFITIFWLYLISKLSIIDNGWIFSKSFWRLMIH